MKGNGTNLFSSQLNEELFPLEWYFDNFPPRKNIDTNTILKYNQADRSNTQVEFFSSYILKTFIIN